MVTNLNFFNLSFFRCGAIAALPGMNRFFIIWSLLSVSPCQICFCCYCFYIKTGGRAGFPLVGPRWGPEPPENCAGRLRQRRKSRRARLPARPPPPASSPTKKPLLPCESRGLWMLPPQGRRVGCGQISPFVQPKSWRVTIAPWPELDTPLSERPTKPTKTIDS